MMSSKSLSSTSTFWETDTQNKDLPLKDDMRMLGKALVDVLKNQIGDQKYTFVENVRLTSIALNHATAAQVRPTQSIG